MPSLPEPPTPLVSTSRDLCWKTFLHPLQLAFAGLDPVELSRGHAPAWRVCAVQYVVWMPGRGRFNGERWTLSANATENLVVLRTSISRLRCNRLTASQMFSFASNDSSYVRTAFRDRPAAALRHLRRGHGQNWKAAAGRTAPARVRLQMRCLQPDHLDRAGTAGRHQPSQGSVNAAATALVNADPHPKTHFADGGRVSSRPWRM
jgi:hypothetical protein